MFTQRQRDAMRERAFRDRILHSGATDEELLRFGVTGIDSTTVRRFRRGHWATRLIRIPSWVWAVLFGIMVALQVSSCVGNETTGVKPAVKLLSPVHVLPKSSTDEKSVSSATSEVTEPPLVQVSPSSEHTSPKHECMIRDGDSKVIKYDFMALGPKNPANRIPSNGNDCRQLRDYWVNR